MELVLTGSPTTATELERFGIVNRVFTPDEDVLGESIKVAETVAWLSAPAVGLAKQAVKTGKTRVDPDSGDLRADATQLRRQR